jgi:hypothetical protein
LASVRRAENYGKKPLTLTDASFVPLERLRYLVRSVGAVKLYYVTAGRNAWWGTWIKRYEPGCMHISFESARSFAEKRRVQGTVFYIVELPTIAIVGSKGALLISEINSQKFFSRFRNARLQKLADTIPVSTMTLNQFAHIFRPKSSIWAANYPISLRTVLMRWISRMLTKIAVYVFGLRKASGVTTGYIGLRIPIEIRPQHSIV